MKPTEVLKMLKAKIDKSAERGYIYAIETTDINAINEALECTCTRMDEVEKLNDLYICKKCGEPVVI